LPLIVQSGTGHMRYNKILYVRNKEIPHKQLKQSLKAKSWAFRS
jgi:hypothetical protein